MGGEASWYQRLEAVDVAWREKFEGWVERTARTVDEREWALWWVVVAFLGPLSLLLTWLFWPSVYG